MNDKSKLSENEKRNQLNAKSKTDTVVDEDLPADMKNEDPLTGTPGFHPVGTGLGTAIGAAGVGAAAGTVAGPVGTIVGAVVGGVIGGLAGKAIGESVNPTEELAYWEKNYSTRPYYREGNSFDYYQPAFRFGWESYDVRNEATWDQREPDLRKKWEDVNRWENEGGAPVMSWEEAKLAAKEAHDRIRENRKRRSSDSDSRKPR